MTKICLHAVTRDLQCFLIITKLATDQHETMQTMIQLFTNILLPQLATVNLHARDTADKPLLVFRIISPLQRRQEI